jgi:hypothetical protein
MAVVALLMWRHIHWIHQRRARFESGEIFAETDPAVAAPGLLRLFGEGGYSTIWASGPVYEGGEVQYEHEIATLFPEARGIYVEIYCPPETFGNDWTGGR